MSDGVQWVYDRSTNRYRDAQTGRFISKSTILGLRDSFATNRRSAMAHIIGAAYRDVPTGVPPALMGDVQREAYKHAFNVLFGTDGTGGEARDMWVDAFRAEYIAGRGGIHAMTSADYVRLNALIAEQDAYWNAFVREIRDGMESGEGLSVNQIRARAEMYVEASTRAYEEARAEAFEITLPAKPGDGKTRCLSNCRCTWDIEPREDGVHCTWMLGASEHCPDCLTNARRWNPLIIPYEEGSDGEAM